MLARIFVYIFGGIWEMRIKYQTTEFFILKKIYKFLYNYNLQLKGSWISLSAKFESMPCFPHGIYGVFISGGAVIGKDCVIFQNVNIGSNTLVDSQGIGAPVIGDSCYIGTGAIIIGNVRIGNNVRIGANTVVYKDVPDNSVVTGSPTRVKQKEQILDNKFYHNYKGKWVFFKNGTWHEVKDSKIIFLLEKHFPISKL